MSAIIDKNVGLTALRLYVENSNLDVGAVTVRHLIFSELIVQVRSCRGLDDAVEVFKLCFGNKHTVKEGKGKKVYESPLKDGYYTDEFGIQCVKISPRLVDLVIEEVKRMELNEANVLAACTDLQIAGRMFQELTIDATKTMLKVDIPYGEDMTHVKLLSRDRDEDFFNAKCDWKYANSTEEEKKLQTAKAVAASVSSKKPIHKKFKNVDYVINTNGSKTEYKKRGDKYVFVRTVADFYQELRLILMTKGLEFADRMMQEEQDLGLDVKLQIASAMKRPAMKKAYEIVQFFHDVLRTIQSYRTASIAAARNNYPNNSFALEEYIAGAKNEAQYMISALANQFRIEFKRLGLSDTDMIYVLMHHVLVQGTNAAYSHCVLQEEFFKTVLNIMADDENTVQYTEDKLVRCDFNEGDIVSFAAGKGTNDSGKIAYATVPLEGEFLIRKNKNGKLVASQKISDNIVAPAIEENTLLFITKPGGGKDPWTSTHLAEITKLMTEEGAKVTLVPFIKGKDIHDAIVINGCVVGSFRCSYAIGGKPVNPEAVTNMYKYKQGTVYKVMTSQQNDTVGQVAIVLMKDVKTVEAPVITGNKIEEYKKQSTQHLGNVNFNVTGCLGSLFKQQKPLTKTAVVTVTVAQETTEEEIEITKKEDIKMPAVNTQFLSKMFGTTFSF